MKFEPLNRWLTLGANLGVLAGILLVAVELGQNREMIRAQTRNDVAVQIVDLLSQVASDPQLASILTRMNDGEELTPTESTQFRHRVLAMGRYFENVHYQYRQGLYDEVEFEGQKEAWRTSYYATASEAVLIWCNTRATYSPEFRAAFDSLLTTPTC